MTIKEIHKFEQAVVMILNIDGWDLKWTGDTFKPYDAIGKTPKGIDCVIEMKFRDKYYEKKLLEKDKYDSLIKLNVVALYFINDPKGNFLYWLNNIQMPEIEQLYCPDTTMWTKKRLKKKVYLLEENQASRINLNKN